jgi:hypothetical protein
VSIQAEAKKVLKAVNSWMRVKSEKASLDEIKVRTDSPIFAPFLFLSRHFYFFRAIFISFAPFLFLSRHHFVGAFVLTGRRCNGAR